jgi:hypothetical protein
LEPVMRESDEPDDAEGFRTKKKQQKHQRNNARGKGGGSAGKGPVGRLITLAWRGREKHQRVGWGVFEPVGWGVFEPADRRRASEFTRYLFLKTIRDLETGEGLCQRDARVKVLAELRGAPLREFAAADLGNKGLQRLLANLGLLSMKRLRPLNEALHAWAERWRLDKDWCLRQALSTLDLWNKHPEGLKMGVRISEAKINTHWSNTELPFMIGPALLSPTLPPPYKGLDPYFPQAETAGLYCEYAEKNLRALLKKHKYTSHLSPAVFAEVLASNLERVKREYCPEVEREYEGQRDSAGAPVWVRVSERRDYPAEVLWAVQAKVLGLSYTEIAKHERPRQKSAADVQGVAHTTVSRAVAKILRLIDLE